MDTEKKEIIPQTLSGENMHELKIIGDGNCFFRCLSQVIDKYQGNFQYYRHLIYIYIYQNKESLKCFFAREENETDENYENRYNIFVDSIRIDKTYAGDYEIAASAIILQRNIIVYRNSYFGYEFLNEYTTSNPKNDNIILCYKNNNHFNVLIPKKDMENYIMFNDKEDTDIFDTLHKKLEKDIKKTKLKDLNKISFNNIFTKIYVPYRRPECPNLYNEIFSFLKKEELPNRLKSTFMKNLDIIKKIYCI